MAYSDDLLAVQTAYANMKIQLQAALDDNVSLRKQLDAVTALDTSALVILATQINNDAANVADVLSSIDNSGVVASPPIGP